MARIVLSRSRSRPGWLRPVEAASPLLPEARERAV